jgi:hypothetical protein
LRRMADSFAMTRTAANQRLSGGSDCHRSLTEIRSLDTRLHGVFISLMTANSPQ